MNRRINTPTPTRRSRAWSATLTREVGRELFVLWLDAHADYNTPSTTLTANMHGMAAAFLCGEGGLDNLLGNEPRAPTSPNRLKLFGTRSIDKLEQDLLRARSPRSVTPNPRLSSRARRPVVRSAAGPIRVPRCEAPMLMGAPSTAMRRTGSSFSAAFTANRSNADMLCLLVSRCHQTCFRYRRDVAHHRFGIV
jgi:Arginase family